MKKRIVALRLKELEEKHGRLTPDLVVKDARDPKSPLHKNAGFQWDLKRAALAHWIDHAREIIATIRIEIKTTTHSYSTVAYTRDPRVPPNEQGYISIAKAIKDKKLSRDIIDLEIKQCLARLERVRELAAPLGQTGRVDQMILDLQGFARQIAA